MSSDVPPPPQPTRPPAGWYPVDGGHRWWDGTQWGQFAPAAPAGTPTPGFSVAAGYGQPQTMEDSGKTQAVFCHVGFFFFSVFLALIFRQTEGEKNEFVKHHATEALNFQLTCAIVWIVAILVAIVTVGVGLIVVIPAGLIGGILAIVWSIQAAIAASRGEWYRYPINWRMVSGAR